MIRYCADIVAINETWIKDGQEARAPSVPGYRLRVAPRPQHMRDGVGGGLGYYIKIGVNVRYLPRPNEMIEQMWLSTRVNGYRIVIGTAYRPEWVNVDTFIDALTDSINHFSNYDFVVFLGDININMLVESEGNTIKFNHFLEYLSLSQLVAQPTHFTSHSEKLIDVVCTNAPVHDITVDNITGSNGHAMINK